MNSHERDPKEFRMHSGMARTRISSHVGLALMLAGTVGLQLGGAPRAHATDSDPTAASLQTIVVTSMRYSENVQDVPMSVTPITSATIQQAGIADFQDYAHMVPNLTFSHSYGVQGADVAIRGIQGGAGTTAFYIDDLSINQAMDPRLLDDVQRIEVLRGPQGTLFGARSMGGAVRIITQAPDTHSWSGAVNSEGTDYSGGRPGFQVDGYLNIPLIADRMALRVSAFDGSTGPFIHRHWLKDPSPATLASLGNGDLAPSQLSQYPLDSALTGRDNYRGMMASLLWQASDNLSVRATFMKQVDNYDGWPLSDLELTPTTSDYTANSLSQTRVFNIPEGGSVNWWLSGLTIKYDTAIGEFTSATGYVHELASNLEDVTEAFHNIAFPSSAPLPSPISSWTYSHSFSEELRFASKPLGAFQFVSGVYVLRSSEVPGQNQVIPGASATEAAEGYPPPYSDLIYYSSGLQQDYEDAIYGDLTYHVTRKLSATVGLRESHIFTAAFFPWKGFIVYPTVGGGGTNRQNVQTPKFDLRYQQSPNLMYYALVSKGFRPGTGQPPPPASFCGSDYAAENLTPSDISKYGADYLWNYEVGAKSETSDHRLLFNADAYQINWSNIQQASRFVQCGFTFTVNAGAARSRGAEITLAVAPVSGLQLSASVGYEHAVITQSSPTSAQLVGQPVQQIAPWTAAASAQYTFPLSPIWSGLFRLDYNYTDHSFSANNPPNMRLRPAYELANVRVGMQSDHWQLAGFVNNLTDAHPNLGDSSSEAIEDPGRPRIYTMAPRTFGIQIGYAFTSPR